MVGQGFFGRVCKARFVDNGERICLKELQNVDPSSAKVTDFNISKLSCSILSTLDLCNVARNLRLS